MIDITLLYDDLVFTNSEHRNPDFVVTHIPGYEGFRIGKDETGAPALLISSSTINQKSKGYSIELKHLEIKHDIPCKLINSDGSIEHGNFSLVRCINTDNSLNSFFLKILLPLIHLVNSDSGSENINDMFISLAELFRSLNRPSKKSVQGLWGELFIIARSKDPIPVIQAWHNNSTDKFDFSQENFLIEVKTNSNKERIHRFSLEQLRPPAGTTLLVASIFVERNESGRSIRELLQILSKNVENSPRHFIKVVKLVGTILGENFRKALDDKYDVQLAEASLRFYLHSDIPSIECNIPPEVSNITFSSDITALESVEPDHFRNKCNLFASALIKRRTNK